MNNLRSTSGYSRLARLTRMVTVISFFSVSIKVSANNLLEEIVVTASKRGEQLLQDTPMTIQAISGAVLEASGVASIEDIASRIPGFTAFNAGANQKKLKIRGISSTSESEPQETVAIYLDDVPLTGNGGTNNENGASPDLSLFDLDRVEVLKGPQSTLYGAGAMGGTVRYILNKPDTQEFDAKISAGFSDTEEGSMSWRTDLMVNLPVNDDFALRMVAHYREDGGYIDNLVQTGLQNETKKGPTSNLDDSGLGSILMTALWMPTTKLSLTGRYMHYDYSVDGESSVDANTGVKVAPALALNRDDLQQVRLVEETNDDDIDLFSLTINYDLEWASFTSTTSHYSRDARDTQDTSIVGPLFFGGAPATLGATIGVPFPLINDNEHEQIVEEARLSSVGDGKLQWLLGVYYQDLDKEFNQSGTAPGVDNLLGGLTTLLGNTDVIFESTTNQTLEQIAVFGEITYQLSEQMEIILGARWFEVEQDFTQTANGLINGGATIVSGSTKEDDINPKATLSYSVNNDVLLYGTAAKGYRAGGINQPVPLDAGSGCRTEVESLGLTAAPASFNSDSIWNYEIGTKTAWLNSRMQFNAAIFHIDWSNIQVRRQLGCGFTFFANSAEAEVNGFEIDVQMQATNLLYLAGTIGYSDGELSKDDSFLGALKGDEVPGVSDLTLSATAKYDFPVFGRDAYIRTDYSYASEFNSLFTAAGTNIANRTAGGFSIINLRVGMDLQENWSVSAFVNNLFDERGVSGTQNNLFGDYEFLLRPRTFGLKTTYSFN